MKRITVRTICQVVSTDGYPVGFDGEEFSRGHRRNLILEKKRQSASLFCPRDVASGARNVLLRISKSGLKIVACQCHEKYRLSHKKMKQDLLQERLAGASH